MRYALTILRRESASSEPRWQTIGYESRTDGDTVASAIKAINADPSICDIKGDPVGEIRWECSCLQKKCGACAMVINGRPRLACDSKLSDLGTDEITIEPLRKFPVVADLIVDRSILMENLRTIGAWLREDANLPDKYRDIAYEASECIQCGCCLEICPNFYTGGNFYGMAAATLTTRLLTETDKKLRKDIAKEYSKHIYGGCGKSLACKDVCPRHIDTEKMLVNSNAMAIWKRR